MLKADLEYKEQPVGIMDTKELVTINIVVKTYKVVWSHHDGETPLGKQKIT